MAGVPFKVKAVYEYTSQETDDLSFPLGQVITVTEEIDADWYEGEYTDVTGVKKSGIFPNNFVEKYEPEIPSRPSRPARPAKEDQAQAPSTLLSPTTTTVEEDAVSKSVPSDTHAAPPVPALSKPAPATDSAAVAAAVPPPPERQSEPVTSPKPVAAELPGSQAKKPPPVAPKSNAFKDRIAAFNQPAAAPVLPFQPGQRNQPPSGFIKKPFVAPPPSKDAYVPAPKQEAVIRPYHREEDPEIRQRQEDDHAAAQAAGLTSDGAEAAEEEEVPKPQSLKDRIAMLQKQQAEQAMRRAEGASKKEKKAGQPSKQASQSSQQEADNEGANDGQDEERLQRFRSPEGDAETADDGQQRTRLPSAQRRAVAPLPTAPPVPQHEIVSGGEEADQSAAEETTDDAGTIGPDDTDSPAKPRAHPKTVSDSAHVTGVADEAADEEEQEEDDEEEEDGLDEETRRRLELRERMAKMSGGMGMPGMFGPPGMMPASGALPPKKRTSNKDKRATDDNLPPSSPPLAQQRVPMVPVPGITRVTSPDAVDQQEDTATESNQGFTAPRRSLTGDRAASTSHALEQSRPAVPSVPSTTAQGYESDDDEAPQDTPTPADTPNAETPLPSRPAAPPVPRTVPAEPGSYFASGPAASVDSNAAPENSITSPRPPPPPPPTAVGQSAAAVPNAADERGESEYEGDYDTDIASSAKRKDALKSHGREPSFDDSTTADETSLKSPVIPEYSRPPPPPPQSSRPPRASADLPRAPPPVPPPRETLPLDEDGAEYDPYKYTHLPKSPPPVPVATPVAVPPPPPPRDVQETTVDSSDDLYSGPAPPRKSIERQPPPPPPDTSAPLPLPPRAPPRQSLDATAATSQVRRSIEQSRVSGEHGQIASDLDLSESTQWWTEADPLPPALEERRGVDILSESEESTSSKRGGRTTTSKDIYILYLDYSQTIITARYDARDPAEVSFEQRHEPPPSKLRQDQLESIWSRFGARLAQTVDGLGNSKKDAAVGDGSSVSLVYELIKSIPEALLPVGTRAYGALVYANLANASVMQYDEIRAGDIVTLRNAKLEGKHSGGLHQKYKQETGTLHVAIIQEWDGTKKKIRVWEQGREKKGGLRSESYRLGDLKSGEVRVWRVVGRDWVGWDGNS